MATCVCCLAWLRGAAAAAATRNYVKFLVNREGQAVARYKPGFDPLDFEADVSLHSATCLTRDT
jgi:glutathione peroxidase-family protein